MESDYKCFWASTCPYYEIVSSYGREVLKCGNTDCALLGIEEEDTKEGGSEE